MSISETVEPFAHTLKGDHRHILTTGEYSAYEVLAVILSNDRAEEIAAAIVRSGGYATVKVPDRYAPDGRVFDHRDLTVECVPLLSTDQRDEILRAPSGVPVLTCSLHGFWDGRTFDNGGHWPVEHEGYADPTADESGQRWYGPEGEDRIPYAERPGPVRVMRDAFEVNYTLGWSLTVIGEDFDRVRKVFSEQRAQMLADPAAATIKAWIARGLQRTGVSGDKDDRYVNGLPAWWDGRTENEGLRSALSTAWTRALADSGKTEWRNR